MPTPAPAHPSRALRAEASRSLRLVVPLSLALLAGAGGGCQPADPADTPLSDDAEVLIDRMGVPHVYAASDQDAFFASGYMTARMRLFQIEMVRRQARGTQGEVLGERAWKGDLLARALDFTRLGAETRAITESEFPTEAALTAAFVRGVNHYIARALSGAETLPGEFAELDFAPTPWTADDPYIVGKLLSLGMSSSIDYKILGAALGVLAPDLPADFPLCMPTRPAFTVPGRAPAPPSMLHDGSARRPAPRRERPPSPPELTPEVAAALARYERLVPELGSNNWAVSPELTTNQRSLLAGDPHQPLGSPIRFFLQHLNSAERGGSLDVIGFGFAGTPGVQLGHNRTVAWTATTNFADVMDLWDVQRAGPGAIELGGQPRPIAERSERVRVRKPGGPAAVQDGLGDDRAFTFTSVPGFGVILPDEILPVPRALIAKGEILFNWTGLAPTREAAMYLGLDRARSLDEWEALTTRLEVGAVNLIAADSGSIRYRVHAKIPDRGDPSKRPLPTGVMPGSDPRTLWSGAFLGDDKLPSARDPEQGYLATANNEPWGFTADGRVDNDPFYYGFYYDPGDRAGRIESELQRLVKRAKEAKDKDKDVKDVKGLVSPADMVALQNDAYSTLAEDLIPPLLEALAAVDTDPDLAAYKGRTELMDLGTLLHAWDRQVRRASPAAVAFFAYAHFAAKRASGDELGPLLGTLFQAEPGYAFKPLRLALRNVPGAREILQEGKRPILLGALADAAAWLRGRFGFVVPDGTHAYAWRDVHEARFNHLLGGTWNAGTFPVDGSVGTVRVSSSSMLDGSGKPEDKFYADDGSLYRMVVSFDEQGPRAQLNFARGNDEKPQSEFYGNQQPAWVEGTTQPLLYRRPEVESLTATRLVLHKDGSVGQ